MALYVISCQRSLAAANFPFSPPFPLGLNVCLIIYNYVGLSIFHSLEDPFFFYPPYKKETDSPIRYMG